MNTNFDIFHSSSKLLKTFNGHTGQVLSIAYSTFNDGQFLCSGSFDKTVRLWNIETIEQIQSFNGHLNTVYCVKFSPYHYHNHHRNVICSSSLDSTIRFWDIKDNQQSKIFNTYSNSVYYISPLQSCDNNSNKSNGIGVIGGNGYTICSGSYDNTIRIWDIETTKQLIVFKEHENYVNSIKYGSGTGCANTILSGSKDKSVRLWDIRSGQQIQVFRGHQNAVMTVEHLPFAVNNSEVGNSLDIVCSGSLDNTIRFWDIRSNKKELNVIHGNCKEYGGIHCLTFLPLKEKKNKNTRNDTFDFNLCYGSCDGLICVWG
ncbi:hypothetical protein RFI_04326 [Reticulomyxa filosa]|uniref:Uncharacterized protein n=1 Tax=Reticulomyxa filosa TaxID=46433 RepID=X6P2K5_RETFI|nr:hypothetical protein RFI_04326 [Reticulomyxa filosa]|eukprot:ETO32790.1 hypothetical protein RFI_04326 [Reticulomyxa filosa]